MDAFRAVREGRAASAWSVIETEFAAGLRAMGEKAPRRQPTPREMECGCAVITNLDEFSPRGLVHMKNVIDINRCDRLPDPEQTERIGRAAREIAHAEYGWDQLVAQLRPVVQA